MSYKIFRIGEPNLGRLVFTDEPSNLVALEMAPPDREPELKRCEWLVLAFAIWSGPDQAQIAIASSIAFEFPWLSVGVRPFDEFTEFEHWLPLPVRFKSPVWVRISSGTDLWHFTRSVTLEEMRDMLLQTDR